MPPCLLALTHGINKKILKPSRLVQQCFENMSDVIRNLICLMNVHVCESTILLSLKNVCVCVRAHTLMH